MLTHIDSNNRPTMVDITDKNTSTRVARAQTLIQLPKEIQTHLQGEELYLKKGPVFQTAIIAGTMAVKKTYETIPFCHHIPIESCKFHISIDEQLLVTVECEVKTTFKTGVEMEALHGATTAALTIYDMCKALSHEIVIKETKLLSKVGGKKTILDRPLYALVLTGGKSERMRKDKALIDYKGLPHAQHIFNTLIPFCEKVYLSAKEDQWKDTPLEDFPTIVDTAQGEGPIRGILSAFEKHPKANWFVVACDLVHFNARTIELILENYDPSRIATAYKNAEKGFPEPLCTIYTPNAREIFEKAVQDNIKCPVKVLKSVETKTIAQTEGVDLTNVNTPAEFMEVQHVFN